MDVAILENRPDRLVAHIRGIDYSVANLIRTSLFMDVKCLAAEKVTFRGYDGILMSEMVAHRIGELPLRFVHRGPLVVGAEARFDIDVISKPGVPKLTWIKSRDIRCIEGDAEIVHYRTAGEEKAASGDHGFHVAALHAGQRLQATFLARVKTGRDGTQWVCAYPLVFPLEDGSGYSVTIETTGAVTAERALMDALDAIKTRLNAH